MQDVDGRDAPLPILVVDDEDLVREVMCELLTREGYAPAGFADPMAALASLAGVPYKLALIDLNMPSMDGIAVIEAALALKPDLGCLIVTGEGDLPTSQRALDAGAIDYLLKPFNIVAVKAGLQRAFRTVALRKAAWSADQKIQQHMMELAMLNRQLILARNSAELANEAKSRFLASMSHELRTPLNSIIGFAHILRSAHLSSTPVQSAEFAGHIVDAANHLLSLVNEVLDLAKIQAGKADLRVDCVMLAPLLEKCARLIAPECERHGVTLIMPDHVGHSVHADATRLQQVLLNLLSNGARYNKPGGTLTVAVCGLGLTHTSITVSDTGQGIAPDLRERLFQPFDRLGRSTSSAEGTGLGLTIADRLMRQMNGTIDVVSTVGLGTTFTIVLPSAATQAGTQPVP
ncbi:ATP-binding response regulator [Pseudoduganella buxea]|nr:ATP-binding protein [Pseudoduganella buxea]